jgi:hypothetical protein
MADQGKTGPTPLDVLLELMAERYETGDLTGAASLARVAAPYVHRREAAKPPAKLLSKMSDAEIHAAQAAGEDLRYTADELAELEVYHRARRLYYGWPEP